MSAEEIRRQMPLGAQVTTGRVSGKVRGYRQTCAGLLVWVQIDKGKVHGIYAHYLKRAAA